MHELDTADGVPEEDVASPALEGAEDAWMAAMRRGEFERAWRISDAVLRARLASGRPFWLGPRHLQPVWTGVPLAGKRVLVRCYHGLGDTIQFVRFAAPLRAQVRHVTYWAQPSLVALVATAPGVDRALPLHDGAPEDDYDVDIESMEVPHALRTRLSDLPRRVPYLFPRAAPTARECAPRPVRVGLVWHAGEWDPRRSVPLALMRRLCSLPNARFFSLQRGPAQRKARELPAEDIGCDDVETTAARALRLDLIITVDTMMAHLAGALAIPTWTLLRARCDWRWMDTRAESPWYPTMRLFRQRQDGNWEEVVEELRTALLALIAERL